MRDLLGWTTVNCGMGFAVGWSLGSRDALANWRDRVTTSGVPLRNYAAHLRTSLPRRGLLKGWLPAEGHWRWPATGPRSRGSHIMTESERKSRNAVQESMDRRDNGGQTGH
jgi:hypothetical protein